MYPAENRFALTAILNQAWLDLFHITLAVGAPAETHAVAQNYGIRAQMPRGWKNKVQ